MNACSHIRLRLQLRLKQGKTAILRTAWLVLALVLWNGPGLHAAISKGERKALIAFYNAANGDNWGKNTGWKDGALEADGFGPVGSESKWYGITVSDDHVLKIRLVFNNLDGVIPPEMAGLSHLTGIHLEGKRLSGAIPDDLIDHRAKRDENMTFIFQGQHKDTPKETADVLREKLKGLKMDDVYQFFLIVNL